MRPLVSVVIVNFNGAGVLRACLRSVFAQGYAPFEVILVDNGSNDGAVEGACSEFPIVKILRNGTNKGFAEGSNIGVAASKGNMVVLLNNDTVVESGWLEGLVEAVTPSTVAVASSLILTEGIPARYYERNGSINLLGHNIMRKYERPESIFFAGGASLIFKKDLLGIPFDPDYFAYAEDVYLSLRARRMGYDVRHTNKSVVRHRGSITTKRQTGAFIGMLQERNRLLNTFLFFSLSTILKAMPLIILSAITKIAVSIYGRRYSLAGILHAYWWLIAHPATIDHKRRKLRAEFAVDEREVIRRMTADLTNGESAAGRLTNHVARGYFKLVGLHTLESFPMDVR
jgi:hypothetical protein